MVIVYKRKYGIYKKIATYKTIAEAEANIYARFGKGRYRIGKSYYLHEKKSKRRGK